MGIFGIFKRKKGEGEKPINAKTVYLEKDNKGTRFEITDHAIAYWMARMSSPKKDPFVLFIFDTKEQAHKALTDLSYIHEAKDTGKPICTAVLNFGYYPMGSGTTKFEAWVCGSELTHEMWQEAMEKFAKHGGQRKNDLEPEKTAPTEKKTVSGDISKVKFVRKYSTKGAFGAINTYEVYRAPDKASAMAFLEKNPVTKGLYYVIVETPEGNYCRDIQGIYQE